ncbi:MAG: hypothetical protein GY866_41160 [Proteobacteria bacterium]|nr:hypothetical protein [Pseudomonadota bacterium]
MRQGPPSKRGVIILAARTSLSLIQPTAAIRMHGNMPEPFLHEITDAVRKQPGVYSLFNDEMMIPFLANIGVPDHDARNYSKEGCMRWNIPGKAIAQRALGGMFALPKCLEYALNGGVNRSDGKRMGASTPDPMSFKTIDDVTRAYLDQLKFFVEKCCTINNVVEVLDQENLPQPFLSALMDDCIERGEDCRTYKYIPNSILQPIGQVTVVNSLAAMKKLIFDDKKATMAELLEALEKNWEGKEALRQRFLNAPKFGNDDDYADRIAQHISRETTNIIRSFTDIYGGSFREDGTDGSTYFVGSLLTGATPDGRKQEDLFADGTISPAPNTDTKGPTAVMNSVAKIDHVNGSTNCLNQKFLPQFLEGKNKENFVAYLKTFVDLGIHHTQFNIIDRETLLEAQQSPDRYSTLIIRVAGYNAYFTDLNPIIQEQIIARTEQAF